MMPRSVCCALLVLLLAIPAVRADTPTPTATPAPLGVELQLPGGPFQQGDLFELTAMITNPGPGLQTDVPLFVGLSPGDPFLPPIIPGGVQEDGPVLWYPSWALWPGLIDWVMVDLPVGTTQIQVLQLTLPASPPAPLFPWGDGDHFFWGFLMDSTLVELQGQPELEVFRLEAGYPTPAGGATPTPVPTSLGLSLWTDQERYQPGDHLRLDLRLVNPGTARDALLAVCLSHGSPCLPEPLPGGRLDCPALSYWPSWGEAVDWETRILPAGSSHDEVLLELDLPAGLPPAPLDWGDGLYTVWASLLDPVTFEEIGRMDVVTFELAGGWPTLTPTPEPTTPPTPTPTEPPPTVTVTPTPDPILLGIRLEMPGTFFHPGDTCFLDAHLHNQVEPLDRVALAVVLDIQQDYWFWPGWTRELDYQTEPVPLGLTRRSIIPEFPWPATGDDSLLGITFWGALLSEDLSEVLGGGDGIHNWSFGFGPAR